MTSSPRGICAVTSLVYAIDLVYARPCSTREVSNQRHWFRFCGAKEHLQTVGGVSPSNASPKTLCLQWSIEGSFRVSGCSRSALLAGHLQIFRDTHFRSTLQACADSYSKSSRALPVALMVPWPYYLDLNNAAPRVKHLTRRLRFPSPTPHNVQRRAFSYLMYTRRNSGHTQTISSYTPRTCFN